MLNLSEFQVFCVKVNQTFPHQIEVLAGVLVELVQGHLGVQLVCVLLQEQEQQQKQQKKTPKY